MAKKGKTARTAGEQRFDAEEDACIDFDAYLGFDDEGFEPRRLDLQAILLAGERKTRTSFVLAREAAQISALIEAHPETASGSR